MGIKRKGQNKDEGLSVCARVHIHAQIQREESCRGIHEPDHVALQGSKRSSRTHQAELVLEKPALGLLLLLHHRILVAHVRASFSVRARTRASKGRLGHPVLKPVGHRRLGRRTGRVGSCAPSRPRVQIEHLRRFRGAGAVGPRLDLEQAGARRIGGYHGGGVLGLAIDRWEQAPGRRRLPPVALPRHRPKRLPN